VEPLAYLLREEEAKGCIDGEEVKEKAFEDKWMIEDEVGQVFK